MSLEERTHNWIANIIESRARHPFDKRQSLFMHVMPLVDTRAIKTGKDLHKDDITHPKLHL